MTQHQREIDFTRSEQRALLRDLKVDGMVGHDGKRVSSGGLKGTLLAIDEYGRGRECFASQETLSEFSGHSRRVIQRAIRCLLDLGLITCERKKMRGGDGSISVNHYRIVWSEISVRILRESGQTNAPPEQTNAPPGSTNAPPGSTNAPLWRIKQFNRLETASTSAGEDSAAADEEIFDSVDDRFDDGPVVIDRPRVVRRAQSRPADNHVSQVQRTPRSDVERGLKAIFGESWPLRADEFADRDPQEVLDAIATVRMNWAKFTRPPGALYYFLKSGVWPTEGIVSPETLRAQTAQRNQRIAHETEAQRQREADEKARQVELSKRFGPRFDSLTDAEILDEIGDNTIFRRHFKNHGRDEVIRMAILEAWAAHK